MSALDFLNHVILPRYFRESSLSNDNKFLNFQLEENEDSKDGLQSEIFIGHVRYEDVSGNVHRTSSMIIKVFPDNQNRNVFSELTFANEIFVYNKILPFYATLNKSIWDLFPKFFFGHLTFTSEDEDGFVALQNLKEAGYVGAQSRIFLDFAHLRLMVKKLGEFHAYSYMAKRTQPRKFFALVDNLIETNYTVVKTIPEFLQPLHNMYIELLSKDERYAKKIGKVVKTITNAEDFIADIYTTREEPMAVLCHGDFLRNNVLFRYDCENKPIDVKFIDVANMKYCSPVVDLALVLYMNTDQMTRDKYWDELLNVYYKSLRSTFPCNVIPSRSQVLSEFKRNALQSYLIVMLFLPIMLRKEECKDADANWLSGLFPPYYEEYESKPLCSLPSDLLVYIFKKISVKKAVNVVVDVLTDILNRNFV